MFTAGQATPSSELLHLAYTTLKMADEEVATKAPESDATQASMVSAEDTPAQTGASMGVCPSNLSNHRTFLTMMGRNIV